MTDKQSVAALVAETVDEVKKAARVYVPVAIFHVRRQLARGGRDHADVHVLPEYAYALRLILQEEYGFQTSSVEDMKTGYSTVSIVCLRLWESEVKEKMAAADAS